MSSITRITESIIQTAAVAALITGTLLLGAVWTFTLGLMLALFSVAFCAIFALRLFAPPLENPAPAKRPIAPLICLALLAAYLAGQMLPLPAGIVEQISPRRVEQETAIRAALNQPRPDFITLAMDVRRTREALLVLLVSALAFFAGSHIAREPRRARRIVGLLIGLVVLEAFYGLLENLSGHNYVLWFPMEHLDARGTFYNRNHFAALLAMFLPITIGWFFYHTARVRRRLKWLSESSFSAFSVFDTRQAFWILVPAVFVFAIIQSHSRGGFAVMILGVALFLAIASRSRFARTVSVLFIPLACAILAYTIYSEYDIVFERFGKVESEVEVGRVKVWADSMGMFRDYPIFGVGFGNFPLAFTQYASKATDQYPFWAHNEWVESLVTVGVLGLAFIIISLAVFFSQAWRVIRRAGIDQPWLCGIWCGLIALAFHCVVEFNLHVPSLAAMAAFLFGVLLGYNPENEESR